MVSELAVVIAGTREDWPGGARTLTPRESTREPNGRTLGFRAELDPDGDPGLVPAPTRTPSARCRRRRPADRGRAPGRRSHRLDHVGSASSEPDIQPLRGAASPSFAAGLTGALEHPGVAKMDPAHPALAEQQTLDDVGRQSTGTCSSPSCRGGSDATETPGVGRRRRDHARIRPEGSTRTPSPAALTADRLRARP